MLGLVWQSFLETNFLIKKNLGVFSKTKNDKSLIE